MTQIMNFALRVPDIQEALLFLEGAYGRTKLRLVTAPRHPRFSQAYSVKPSLPS